MPTVENQSGVVFGGGMIAMQMEHCCNCGVAYAMTQGMYEARRRDGGLFYCPNGHPQQYTETRAAQLEKQLQRERQAADQIRADRDLWRKQSERNARRHIAAKGRITRLRNRCVGGLCTCCAQHFPDLEKHMKAEHPDAAASDT